MDIPIVIAGGGRWGRTWASVVTTARGSGKGVSIAARSDPDAVRAWIATQSNLAGICVVANLAEAMTLHPRSVAAIVASRPRDHVRDVLEALQLGLHVLVEKPISVDVRDGHSLLGAAQKAGRVLAVGTEFAYLPALHQIAGELAERGRIRLRLSWDDAANEFRHGATKMRHDEVGLLQDLLPHAFSIFRVFAPDKTLHVVDAHENRGKNRGWIKLEDGLGGSYELFCDVEAAARRRLLEIENRDVSATLDFSEGRPSLSIDGRPLFLDPQLLPLTSTLRLELGAFLAMATGAIEATFIVDELWALLRLQAELERYMVVLD
jgi:predicted dehydrogenase